MKRITGTVSASAVAFWLIPMAVALAGQPAARQSDTVSGNGPPGTILSGSPTVLIDGRPAARLGDPVTCGIVVAGVPTLVNGTIATGHAGVLINGKPAARLGDLAGPCTIATGSATVLD